jgi:sialidase-1
MKGLWIAGLLLVPAAALAEPTLKHVNVYTSGADGYKLYRIPVIETAPDGSLLAFAEARKYHGSDPGDGKEDIDLVLKRSSDGGLTWSAMKIIEHPGEFWSAANPATVVDRNTRRVWVLYLRSKPGRGSESSRPGSDDMQTLARYSSDNGITWSKPIDLTKVARDYGDPTWQASVVGPGGAIQTSSGRLIAPVWKLKPYALLTIFSDDHGQTWQRGGLVPGKQGGNEDQLVELADGRLLLDIRQNSGPRRLQATSGDAGKTWSKPRTGELVTEVACAIKRLTLQSAGDDRNRIVWTGPKGPGRKNLVARVSYDEGRTFINERLIAEEPAAYSDLTVLNDKSVGVLWERGNYRFITFTRLPRAFLEPKGP